MLPPQRIAVSAVFLGVLAFRGLEHFLSLVGFFPQVPADSVSRYQIDDDQLYNLVLVE